MRRRCTAVTDYRAAETKAHFRAAGRAWEIHLALVAKRNLFVSGPPPRRYLYLSGTPFRAITHSEFTEDAVFNQTYVNVYREKQHWEATLFVLWPRNCRT